MNKNITETGTKEAAVKIFGLLKEDFEKAVAKVKDMAVLKELWIMTLQRDEDKLKKIIQKRIEDLGGKYK